MDVADWIGLGLLAWEAVEALNRLNTYSEVIVRDTADRYADSARPSALDGNDDAPDHIPVAPLPGPLEAVKEAWKRKLEAEEKEAAAALDAESRAARKALREAVVASVEPEVVARLGAALAADLADVHPHQSQFLLHVKFDGHYSVVAAFERCDCRRQGEGPAWRRKDFAPQQVGGVPALWKVLSPGGAYAVELGHALALAEMTPEAVRRERESGEAPF